MKPFFEQLKFVDQKHTESSPDPSADHKIHVSISIKLLYFNLISFPFNNYNNLRENVKKSVKPPPKL